MNRYEYFEYKVKKRKKKRQNIFFYRNSSESELKMQFKMSTKQCKQIWQSHILRHKKINFIIILGLFILNSSACCDALPHPQNEPETNFRPNFAVEFGAPLITPLSEYVVLEKDSNYTLRCEANEPIEWKIQCETCIYSTQDFNTHDPQRPFGKMLYLLDITHSNVGGYYCIKQSSLPAESGVASLSEENLAELVNSDSASTIYLYVNDPENLLAQVNVPILYAQQFEDITIPCKPTMPDGIVLLTGPDGETHSSENTGKYDPQRGFVVEIRSIHDTGLYICQPKIPSSANEEESIEMEINFVGNEHFNPSVTPNATMAKKSLTTLGRNAPDPQAYLKSTVTNTVHVTNSTIRLTNVRQPVNISNSNGLGVGQINVALTGDGDEREDQTISSTIPTITTTITTTTNSTANRIDTTFSYDIIIDTTSTPPTTTTNYQYYSTTDNSVEYQYITYDEDSIEDSEETDSDLIEASTTSSTIGSNNSSERSAGGNGGGGGVGSKRSFNKRALRTTVASHRSSSYAHYHNTPRTKTKYIEKPNITSASRGHAYVGSSFQLICEVRIAHDVRYTTKWTTPPGVDESRVKIQNPTFQNHTVQHNLGRSVLTVENAAKTDTGNYKCTVIDNSRNEAHTKYLMTILNDNESYITIGEPNNYYDIKETAGKTIQMTVKYRGFPTPSLTWYKPDGNVIQQSQKYQFEYTDTSTTLRITQTQMLDSGDYIVHAANGIVEKKLKFNVSVTDKPIATVDDVHVQAGQEAHVECRVVAVPVAVVSWVFKPCSIKPRWPTCEHKFDQSFNSTRNARQGSSSIEYIHDLYFTPESPGIIHCLAINGPNRSTNAQGHILLGDIAENLTISGVEESRKIAREDEVSLTCGALAYYFANNLEWFKDGQKIYPGSDVEITDSPSEYSHKKILKLRNVQDRDRGRYECRARYINDNTKSESVFADLFIHEPLAPKWSFTNLNNSKFEHKLGDALELECKTEAIPRANVNWYRGDQQLSPNKDISIDEDNTKLIIHFIKPEDAGDYKCVASNRLGSVALTTSVVITNMPGVKTSWIVGAVVIFVLLVVALVCLVIFRKRDQKQLRALKAAGLANFEEGAVEQINPALTLDEQADLLPYDRAFEFPRDKLKLGKQLGAGAFGVVVKAFAEGIKPDEKESIVAVKMVKRTADNEVMRALVSELKIMVHLGQHLNVVNLLGAVTKNIAKRELMVIVEYCRYGNVQNFLLRNRKHFIDQINPETGKIDPTIMVQRFSDNFELNRNSENDPRPGTRAGRPNSSGYQRRTESYEGPVNSAATEQTILTTIPDEEQLLSNNSAQPAWRSNYKPDSVEARTVTTSHLVSWAFQVARGMDYLSSRKVLHGDLAARNILLCEDNIVKICDFGLARSMYKSDNYKKQGEAPLPIKWLALESWSDHVFSTYTDVWSFGIVLWEFFSLAKVPYPGMAPNHTLFLKLKDGYRMEKPPFANDDLYDTMLQCWRNHPESRPLFNELEKRFARMLGDEVTNHYLDLNEPYLRVNNETQNRNQTDYLALMGSPDEMAPPIPRYVNGHILPEIRIDPSDDYLQMSTNSGTAIFSPTRPKESDAHSENEQTATSSSFTFPDSMQQNSPTLTDNLDNTVNKIRRKDIVQPEEIPMLHSIHHGSGSDGERSPEQLRKFSNILQQSRTTPTPSPRHHIETQLNGSSDIQNVDDNYVNVISPAKHTNGGSPSDVRNASRTADAYSNPNYQPIKTAIDHRKELGT